MKTTISLRACFVCFAVMGMTVWQSALADQPVGGKVSKKLVAPAILDVTLHDGGVLIGAFVDAQGTPVKESKVSIRHQGEEVLTADTDANGRFMMREVRGGVYEIATVRGNGMFRLWAPGTAPPNARQAALLVGNDGIVRGQNCCDDPNCSGCGGGVTLFDPYSPAFQVLSLGLGAGGLATGIVALNRANRRRGS